ncbi:hypothetical protein [Kineosporia sp. A_224]|uniref:hypothetical protein n=1 Tax=Kineosporia sp. A_224 TaxID=1962180 RepID=UPI00117A0D05|nr:hypothetical protein [Kineosporia sp. A_224]
MADLSAANLVRAGQVSGAITTPAPADRPSVVVRRRDADGREDDLTGVAHGWTSEHVLVMTDVGNVHHLAWWRAEDVRRG